MNYTRRKRYNSKKTRKHRGGINWQFWKTAPTAPAPLPVPVPVPVPTAPAENKCPPCPICAQKEEQQQVPMPVAPEQSAQAPMDSLMIGGKRRRGGRKSTRKNKSKKWFQMGCKSLF